MKENEIRKLIGKLKYCSDVWKFKEKKAESYIDRLEEHLLKVLPEGEYENIKRRDRCLLEEIASFMEE